MLVDHTTGAEAHRGKFLGAHISQPLVFDYFQCRGSETNLLECGRGIGRVCHHSTDISVICSESVVGVINQIDLCIALYQNVLKLVHSSAHTSQCV